MKLKRRNALGTLGIGGIFLCIFLIWCVPLAECVLDPGSGSNAGVIHKWIGLSGLMVTVLTGQFQTSDAVQFNPFEIQGQPLLLKNVTSFPNGVNSSSSNSSLNETKPIMESSINPRRLSKLPRNHSIQSRNRPSRIKNVPESAKIRARTLLGSLNRQNCFAKVLCGLGARPPSTKTDLVNDYVYLMEELLVDEEDDETPGTKKKTWGKENNKDKKKPYTKKDDSDSSQSEESKEEKDKDPELGWMADEELVGEDPAVLRYVKLEQKRRKLKTGGTLSKRMSRIGQKVNTTKVSEVLPTISDMDKNTTKTALLGQETHTLLNVKKTRRFMNKMEKAVRAGRTFGGSRQCRTIFNRCPFDNNQMDEIITNLKKMMQGQANQNAPSNTPNSASTISNGGAKSVINSGQSTSGPGSKVEIVLHLNQNGMPYPGSYPMQYPGSFTSNQPGVSVASPVQIQPEMNMPPLQSVFPPFMPHQPSVYTPSPSTEPSTTTTTTTTPTPETTTVQSAGEEQLLDFLYGVVNFNETEAGPLKPLERNPNPFWALANQPIKETDALDDIEVPLKVKKRKPPNFTLNEDDDDDSRSSEEVELKQYLISLKETLEGLAQMNNATLAVEQKVVKSSEEEDSSPEDILEDGGFALPGIPELETEEEDEEEDDRESATDKEVKLKVKGKEKNNKKSNKPPRPSEGTKFSISTPIKSPTKSPDSEPLFDEDNEDNREHQTYMQGSSWPPVKNSPPKRQRPSKESDKSEDDDEYEPEQSRENGNDNNDEGNSNNQENTNEDNNDDRSEDDTEDSDELPTIGNLNRKDPPREKITIKFEQSEAGSDPYEMSEQEKHKLAALSSVLMPTPSGPPRPPPHKKHKPDPVEQIRLPMIKPVMKEFQSVANLAQNTAVINIDEFAEDSGKTPVFPKKNLNRPRRPYQNQKTPPVVQSSVQEESKPEKKPESSEEEEEDDDEKSLVRNDSVEIVPTVMIPITSSYKPVKIHTTVKYTLKQKPKQKPKRNRPRRPSLTKVKGSSDSDRPLIAIPYHPVHPSPSNVQQNHDGNYDFLGSVFSMMGLRSVSESDEGQPPSYGNGHHPTGYIDLPHQHMQNARPYIMDFEPQEKSRTKKNNRKNNREKSDLSEETENQRRPQPKIFISVPVPGYNQEGHDGYLRQDKDDKKKKEDKKEEGTSDGDKGKDKEKDKKKKKKKKKKGNKDDEEHGFSTQFHQQVFPAPEKETGIWDKIKGYIGKLGGSDTGETPFIQLGFSDSNPVEDSDKSSASHGHHGHSHGTGPGHGPVFQQNFDSDEHSEEEDEEEEEEDDIGFSDESDRDNPKKIENKPTRNNITTHGEPTSDEIQEQIPPSPTPSLTSTTVDPKLVLPLFPTTKSTIAPKPPKYRVNQNRLQTKKQKGDRRTTTGQPISLFVTTTEPPPTTRTTTDRSAYPKGPKRKIVYKSGGQRVVHRPGSAIPFVTTLRTTTLRPLGKDKDSGEDDEIEPLSVFFQPGPKGQNIRGRPPIPIEPFHSQSEDMLTDSSEMRSSEQKHRRRSEMDFRHRPRRPPPGPNSPEDESAITTAVMNSAIFSNHFKHLYAKFQSFGQYLNPGHSGQG